jgi:hypothetical protein
MNNSYVIQWKSKVNGRAGRGTKRFEKEEVDRLVEELNREYPQIEHAAIPATDMEPEPAEEAEATTTTDATTPMLSLA